MRSTVETSLRPSGSYCSLSLIGFVCAFYSAMNTQPKWPRPTQAPPLTRTVEYRQIQCIPSPAAERLSVVMYAFAPEAESVARAAFFQPSGSTRAATPARPLRLFVNQIKSRSSFINKGAILEGPQTQTSRLLVSSVASAPCRAPPPRTHAWAIRRRNAAPGWRLLAP